MNLTDIADQLHGSYRPDRWMRQRKWWWAFFIWSIGVAGVNVYKIYKVLYDKEDVKKTPGLPPRWTHARFLEELVYDFPPPADQRTMLSSNQSQRATWTRQRERKHHQFAHLLCLDREMIVMGWCMT
jgi:hypothetical protein